MPEGPVETPGTRAAPVRIPAAASDGDEPKKAESESVAVSGTRLGGEIPRVVIKPDLIPALSVLSLISMLGLPLGWLWSRLAPAQESMFTGSGEPAPLLTVETYHRFDSLATFLLLSLAVGVLTASALWMSRRRRGPVMLIAGALGSLLAGWLAIRVGTSLAAGLYPVPADLVAGEVFTVAPDLTEWWAVLAQPLALSLVYGLAASWNGLDDLGRRLG